MISGPQFGPGCVWCPFLQICGTPDTGRGAEDPWTRDARRDPSVHAAGQIHILQHHVVWTPVFKAHIPCCPQSRRPAQPWPAFPGSYMFIHARRVRLQTNPHKKKQKNAHRFRETERPKGKKKKTSLEIIIKLLFLVSRQLRGTLPWKRLSLARRLPGPRVSGGPSARLLGPARASRLARQPRLLKCVRKHYREWKARPGGSPGTQR